MERKRGVATARALSLTYYHGEALLSRAHRDAKISRGMEEGRKKEKERKGRKGGKVVTVAQPLLAPGRVLARCVLSGGCSAQLRHRGARKGWGRKREKREEGKGKKDGVSRLREVFFRDQLYCSAIAQNERVEKGGKRKRKEGRSCPFPWMHPPLTPLRVFSITVTYLLQDRGPRALWRTGRGGEEEEGGERGGGKEKGEKLTIWFALKCLLYSLMATRGGARILRPAGHGTRTHGA